MMKNEQQSTVNNNEKTFILKQVSSYSIGNLFLVFLCIGSLYEMSLCRIFFICELLHFALSLSSSLSYFFMYFSREMCNTSENCKRKTIYEIQMCSLWEQLKFQHGYNWNQRLWLHLVLGRTGIEWYKQDVRNAKNTLRTVQRTRSKRANASRTRSELLVPNAFFNRASWPGI